MSAFAGVLAVLVGIAVILFVLARNMGAVQKEWLASAVLPQPPGNEVVATAIDGRLVYRVYGCMDCHDALLHGAPGIFVPEDYLDWKPRIEQGQDVLYRHAIEGLGAMPPRGGNAAVSDAQVHAAVDYMLNQLDNMVAFWTWGCGHCHGGGWEGAPSLGNLEAWEPRLSRGREALYRTVFEGFGGMPARGGYDDPNDPEYFISDAEIRAAVSYMLAILPIDDLEAALSPVIPQGPEQEGLAVFQRACQICHAPNSPSGAPPLGNAQAWEPRIAQGLETLYRHAIEGFQGSVGYMPARGSDPSLSDEQVRAAVDYIVGQVQ